MRGGGGWFSGGTAYSVDISQACVQYRAASMAEHRSQPLFQLFFKSRERPIEPAFSFRRLVFCSRSSAGFVSLQQAAPPLLIPNYRWLTWLTGIEVRTRRLSLGHNLADIINPEPAAPDSLLSLGQPINSPAGYYIISAAAAFLRLIPIYLFKQ